MTVGAFLCLKIRQRISPCPAGNLTIAPRLLLDLSQFGEDAF